MKHVIDPVTHTILEVQDFVDVGDHLCFPVKEEFVPFVSSFPDSPPIKFREAIVVKRDERLELRWLK